MKNKETEEILNYMKQYVENKYEHDSEPMLNYKDLQIVLSYIEQLQTTANKCKQLQNNRDKAIEYLKFENPEIFKNPKYTNHLWTIDGLTIKRFIDILKGDSDEFRNN